MLDWWQCENLITCVPYTLPISIKNALASRKQIFSIVFRVGFSFIEGCIGMIGFAIRARDDEEQTARYTSLKNGSIDYFENEKSRIDVSALESLPDVKEYHYS